MSYTENYSRRSRASSWLRQFSMRTQMVGAMVVLSGIATLGMAVLAYMAISSAFSNAEEQRLKSVAGALGPQITVYFDEMRRALVAEADFQPVRELLVPQPNRPISGFTDYFSKVLRQNHLRDILLVNNTGVVIYCHSKTIDAGTTITNSPDVDTYGALAKTYNAAMKLDRSINPDVRVASSDLWFSNLFGDPVWINACPVFQENGLRQGAIVFLTDPAYITNILTAGGNYEAMKMGATGDIFLRGEDGSFKSGYRIRGDSAGKLPKTQNTVLQPGERAGDAASTYTNFQVRDVFGISVPVRMGITTNYLQLEVDSAEVFAPARRIQLFILVFGGVVIFGGVCFAFWFSGTVAGTLRDAMSGLETISSSARRTSHGFEEASERLSSACLQQAASLQEISSSHEEMTAMSRQNATGAKKAADLTRQARETVKHCAEDIARMIAAVDAIRTSSQDSMKVVRSIDEVAFRTKLIALNAAIEAARAEGQSGAAFSVVADEVRRLAQSSADAARGTSDKMEAVVQDAVRAAGLTENVSRDLATIVRQVKDIDLLSEEIAHSSQEQALGFEQISKAVVEIDRVTQTAAAASSESASAGRSLRENAADLGVTVQQLRMLVDGTNAKEASEPVPAGEPDEAGIISF